MNSSGDERFGAGAAQPAGPRSTAGGQVVVDDLSVVKRHRTILRDVCLQLAPGKVTGLLGPSGCGKTTLMRTIVGVQRPAAGHVEIFGATAGARSLRGRIGYMTQQGAVYTDLSVRQSVAYFGALVGCSRSRVEQVISDVGLAAHDRQRVATLSGGEVNRVSLACALVGEPELLVLDEPTVGLDPLTREDLWRQFRDLARAGCTLLVSSHVMDEALRCDRLVLMREGTVLGQFTPDSLLTSTKTSNPDEAFLRLLTSRPRRASSDTAGQTDR